MKEAPERLSTRIEYGDGLTELKAEEFSAERLAEGWRAIEADLGGVTMAPSGSDLVAAASETGTLLKLTTGLLVAGALVWAATQGEAPDMAQEVPIEPAAEASQRTLVEPSSSLMPLPQPGNPPAPDESVSTPTPLNAVGRSKPTLPRGVFKGPPPTKALAEAKPKPTMRLDASKAPSRNERKASLASALADYREAELLVKQGDYAEARALLERLVADGSVVAPESQALRARVLSLEGNHAEAIEALDSLLAVRPLSQARRASLLRMLGDALAKSGRCGRAILSYKKALELGVSPGAEEAIGRAIRVCGATD